MNQVGVIFEFRKLEDGKLVDYDHDKPWGCSSNKCGECDRVNWRRDNCWEDWGAMIDLGKWKLRVLRKLPSYYVNSVAQVDVHWD